MKRVNAAPIFMSLMLFCAWYTPAFSQNAVDVVEECEKAIENNDTDTIMKHAEEIKDWTNLFNTALIKKGEACLQAATGVEWKYFSRKSAFLSGDEARAEEDFVASAGQRREEQKIKFEKLRCEIVIAEEELNILVEQQDSFRNALVNELFIKTQSECNQLYKKSPNEALLNITCQDIFQHTGIPDSKFDFDYSALTAARQKYSLAVINQYIEVKRGRTSAKQSTEYNKCVDLRNQ